MIKWNRVLVPWVAALSFLPLSASPAMADDFPDPILVDRGAEAVIPLPSRTPLPPDVLLAPVGGNPDWVNVNTSGELVLYPSCSVRPGQYEFRVIVSPPDNDAYTNFYQAKVTEEPCRGEGGLPAPGSGPSSSNNTSDPSAASSSVEVEILSLKDKILFNLQGARGVQWLKITLGILFILLALGYLFERFGFGRKKYRRPQKE